MRRPAVAISLRFPFIMLLLLLTFVSLAMSAPETCAAEEHPCAWTHMSSGTSRHLFDVWGSSATDIFAVGDGGCVLHYDGSEWSVMDSGITDCLNAVWGSGPGDVFAGGELGVIVHYDGHIWSTSPGSPLPFWVESIWGSSPTDVYAAGGGGVRQQCIAHYDGSSWQQVYVGEPGVLYGIWGSSPSDIYAVGEDTVGIGPSVLHYDGSTWQNISSRFSALTIAPLRDIWGSSSSDVFIVSDDDIIHFDGSKWTMMPSNYSHPNGYLQAVSGTSASDVYAAGLELLASDKAASVVLHYDGNSWTRITTGTIDVLYGVWCSSSSDVFAVGNVGTIVHYVEGPPPEIESCSPSRGRQGDTLDVTIAGSSLAYAEAVSLGDGITVGTFDINSDAEIVARISISLTATPGSRAASVSTSCGVTVLPDAFTVDARPTPVVEFLSPNHGKHGDVLDVTITGAHFSGVNSVSLGDGITVDTFNVNSDTEIVARISISPTATPGSRAASVSTSCGVTVLPDAFTVDARPVPVVESLSPNHGKHGDVLDVTITGAHFSGVNSVSLGDGITVDTFSVNSDTEIVAKVTIDSTAESGDRDVSVAAPWGTATLDGGFTVEQRPTPEVESLNVGSGLQGKTLEITITGSFLSGVDTVSFGDGITVNDHTVNSDSELVVNITIASNAEPGDRDVVVAAPWGKSTLTEGFKVKKESGIASSTWTIVGSGIAASIAGLAVGFVLGRRRPASGAASAEAI